MTIARISLFLLVLLMMQMSIYLLAPNKKWIEFPKKCRRSSNCTRVAETNTRGYGLKPISLKGNTTVIQEKIISIINERTRMTILNEKKGFIHAVEITPFFRFHDDVAIRIFESGKNVIIWLQSQSRLGLYDFNVNERRIQKLHDRISVLK